MSADSPGYELPRALAPLPGESLRGLLLRLSYRLERQPAQIAAVCGLMTSVRPASGYLLELPIPLAHQVGRTLRLSADEAQSLTLSSLTDTQPPPASTRSDVRHTFLTSGSNWSFTLSSRFCPQCLHGDGSPIQEAFGGAWKLRWHLPTAFTCPQHHCLLESGCPECRQPPNGVVQRHRSLIQSPAVSGLHPAQCRHILPPTIRPKPGSRGHIRACGTRFDESQGAADKGMPAEDIKRLINLQLRMDQRLRGGPGEPSQASYLPDLAMATLLIKLSWPLGSTLLPSEPLKASLDAHAAPAAALAAARRSDNPTPAGRLIGLRNLPNDAAQCGALLLAAEALLDNSDATSLSARVQPLARSARERAPAYVGRALNKIGVSPALAQAAARRVHAFPEAPTPRAMAPAGTFQLHNVPPFLPKPWFDAYFADILERLPHVTGFTVRRLRRGASLRLAEIASGLPWTQCATALDISAHSTRSAINALGRDLGPHHLWPMFESAVAEVARGLGKDSNPIDFTHRRRALVDWRLPLQHWLMLVANLPMLQRLRTKADSNPGTVFIWSEATSAEHYHSPLVKTLRDDTRAATELATEAGRFYKALPPSGGWRRLHRRLDMYAAELAGACDRGEHLLVDVGSLLRRENDIERSSF
ncbi:TniQ family protein [Streptomyces sp. NPDC055134]